MHILIREVINDDGPPSADHSPYVRTLVATLQAAGHVVSVVLPHTQRSWIGKAHLVGASIALSYLRPDTFHAVDSPGFDAAHPAHLQSGEVSDSPLPASSTREEWILVDGTPATCAQLGLHHLFRERGPAELVISGPNFGRNSSTVYALSSGTIGGAMEAAACGARAVALSWAYDSREHRPKALEATARQSVRVVEWLAAHWGADVDVYNVNVPVREEVEASKVVFTTCLRNTWRGVSAFREVDRPSRPGDEAVALADKTRREEEEAEESAPPASTGTDGGHARFVHRYFEWAPSHQAVRQSVAESQEGNDGLALTKGWTSITPLRAAFMEATAHPLGELKM